MSLTRRFSLGLLAFAALTSVQAQEKFTYMTNWYAQAEHGGFYQAIATGIYKKYGLDVTVKIKWAGRKSTTCSCWPLVRPIA